MVQDESTENLGSEGDHTYKLLLYSWDMTSSSASFFGGIPPKNLYSNYKDLENIKKYVNLILKYNVYIEAVVQLVFQKKSNPVLLLLDSTLHSSYLNN